MTTGHLFVSFSCIELVEELRRELEEVAAPDYELPEDHPLKANSLPLEDTVGYKELLGASLVLLGWSDRERLIEQEGLSLEFAKQDFLDRVGNSPVNPGKAVEIDTTGVLKPYLSDGLLDYTYSERMFNQLQRVIDLLNTHPETRQAYMSIWDRIVDPERFEVRRVPCSIGYHFLLRNGRLTMIYLMRSLDAGKCIAYDLYTSSRLLEYVAEKVGAEPGALQLVIGSVHQFERDG